MKPQHANLSYQFFYPSFSWFSAGSKSRSFTAICSYKQLIEFHSHRMSKLLYILTLVHEIMLIIFLILSFCILSLLKLYHNSLFKHLIAHVVTFIQGIINFHSNLQLFEQMLQLISNFLSFGILFRSFCQIFCPLLKCFI